MTAHDDFWNWFVRHDEELFKFDPTQEIERERIFDELAAELAKIDRDLSFEFGPKASVREFVVSASGIERAFPAVVALVKHAPSLERWKIIAFRPRRPATIVEIGGTRVDPGDVWFTLLDSGKTAGINLFIPGFREDDVSLKEIGYLLLDETLGEFDVVTRLGLITMLSPQTSTKGGRYQLTQLPELFDQLVARLEGRFPKPS
jgi:hypothetical protein